MKDERKIMEYIIFKAKDGILERMMKEGRR